MQAVTEIITEGTILENAVAQAAQVLQSDVHDQHFEHTTTVSTKKSWFGASTMKTSASSSSSSTSRGNINKGRQFIAMISQSYKAVNPTFQATRSDIFAPKVEIGVGVNQSQSASQSTSKGLVWTSQRVEQSQSTTHVNPQFEGKVHVHSPEVIVQRMKGSREFANLFSDSAVHYEERVDQQSSMSKSQRSLSTAMQILIKGGAALALGLTESRAIWYPLEA